MTERHRLGGWVATGLFSLFVLIQGSLAWAAPPPCMANDHGAIPIANEEVLEWKDSTPNQYLDRAHISGTVIKILKNRKTHLHLQVQIGKSDSDTIEVIYNKAFGRLPKVGAGTQVEACGDYITSNAPAGSYPASPEGAILHWVHLNTGGGTKLLVEKPKHEDGFLMLDGVVYGNRPGEREPLH